MSIICYCCLRCTCTLIHWKEELPNFNSMNTWLLHMYIKTAKTTHELHVPFYLIFLFILVVFYSNCLITNVFNIFFLVEGCSIGFHFFEKVQDLPTRGALDVEHFTIDGSLFLAFANHHGDIKKFKTSSMIYKMDNSTGRLSLYQTLQTRGAYYLEYFSIANKHFLAVANHNDGTYRLDSSVYQWNGKLFVDFQNLSTNGAGYFTYFKILGENYLAVANHYDGSTHSIKSVIYKWSSGKFNRFQDIPTEGAVGCTAFVINGDTFIAFANNYNSQHKYSVQSTVFKWSGGHFVKLQSLQTYGARDVKSFNVNGHTFLAFANQYSGVSTTSIPSFTNGMEIHLSCSNPFLLEEPLHGVHLWSTVSPMLVWLITMVTVRNTILSQLCTRPLEQGSSSTKRFPHMERMVWRHLSTKVILTLQYQTTTISRSAT